MRFRVIYNYQDFNQGKMCKIKLILKYFLYMKKTNTKIMQQITNPFV